MLLIKIHCCYITHLCLGVCGCPGGCQGVLFRYLRVSLVIVIVIVTVTVTFVLMIFFHLFELFYSFLRIN